MAVCDVGNVDLVLQHRKPYRSPARAVQPKMRSPGWLRPLVITSITAFYFLIGPTGRPLIGGLGNLVGIALVFGAMTLRLSRTVQYPDLAGRALFYLALPFAVGVPWGFLVLSLPALAASLYCCRRADQLRIIRDHWRPHASHVRYRMAAWDLVSQLL